MCAALWLAGCTRTPATVVPADVEASVADVPEDPVGAVDAGADAAGAHPDEVPRLFRDLSEPGQSFLSDNLVSNETSYLQVAAALRRRARPGGAYVGVGPEQNFTYLALVEPRVAFLVDLRRENAVEHLYYRALFDLAESRAHFLALLLGHPYDPDPTAPADDATVEELLAYTTSVRPDEATWSARLDAVRDRIVQRYGIALDAADEATLRRTARAFFDRQLGLAFEMHAKSWRRFPTLGALLAQRSPEGEAAGFLGSERAFRAVQRMERDGRVVPVVGDFGGDHALRGVGDELRARGLTVAVFYVSNVEEYVMPSPPKWRAWIRNVLALPHTGDSLFVRCHLDQGRAHPAQMPGHRTTTVLQRFDRFERDAPRYRSFWDLAVDADP